MVPIRRYWQDIRSSLWFIPTIMVVAFVGLAVALIEVDASGSVGHLVDRWPRLFGAGADGSRGMLSAIAGSMITVAASAFSITIVALTLASSQYSSRILRTFMRDRANQTVLGFFMAAFAYCLVVLRTIRGGDDGMFVPGLSVLVAVLLAFAGIGFLIFFIHHIAASLQATVIIESVTRETLEAVNRCFPDDLGATDAQPLDVAPEVALTSGTWTAISSGTTGYIQGIAEGRLLDLAGEEDVVVRMDRAVGDFVIKGCPLASTSGTPLDDPARRKLLAAFTVSRHRTVHGDPAYGIRQLVDVALKALSPGINDTTTAINCVDYLGSILAELASRRIESAHRSADGQLRVITRGPTFSLLLSGAFDEIRQNAEGNVAVLARLHQVLATLVGLTDDETRLRAIEQHAALVTETAQRSVPSAHDRATIEASRSGRHNQAVA